MVNAPASRVLIVVPTLGERLETLERTLRSIADQMDVGVDCVVVGPRDQAALRHVTDRNGVQLEIAPGHISAAVNRGWSLARPAHRYLAWLGDDDLLRAGALRRAVDALERNPRDVVAFGDCDYIAVNGSPLFTRRPPPAADWWLQFAPGLIKQEACVFKRDAVQQAGGLDEELRFAMDLDLLLKLRRIGPFSRVNAVQAAFCWHGGSITVANRTLSFAEAQKVQVRAARGLARWISPVVQPVMKHLVLGASEYINRRHLRNF